MKQVLLVFILLSLLSCCSKVGKKQQHGDIFENIWGLDTLNIEAQFSDCGEWGGHHERFTIYRDTNKKLMTRYVKDKVDCSKPDSFDRLIVEDKTLELSIIFQQHLMNYINELIIKSFENEGAGNSANCLYLLENRIV